MKMTSVRFRDWSEPALVVKKTQLKHPVLQRQVFTFIFAILCGYYRKHGTDAPHDTFSIAFQACFGFFRNLVRLQENGLIAKVS